MINSNVYKLGVSYFAVFSLVTCGPPPQINIDPITRDKGHRRMHNGVSTGIRLPRDVIPLHYDLRIMPIISLSMDDLRQFTSPGEVIIRILCTRSTRSITFHSNDTYINFKKITVRVPFPVPIYLSITDYSVNKLVYTNTIHLNSELQEGVEYELYIPFISKVAGDRLMGLYRSSYLDASGNRKWLAATQFEPIDARSAFPCFDEPNFRTTFSIVIGRPEGYNSLSNGRLTHSEPMERMPNWYWDYYETTVSMSTYLVAFVVSDFVAVNAPPNLARYPVKTWGPPPITNPSTTAFSTTASAELLTFFENYFQLPYQFSKMDSVGLPDFANSGMENVAQINYKIGLLIHFEGETTQYDMWRSLYIISHEMAHQWFGDLVTCASWNELWLNEGFAEYMSYIGANYVRVGGGFNALDWTVINNLQPGMKIDAGPDSEPVRTNDTDQTHMGLRDIIYGKSPSLVRMLHGVLGEHTLMGGLKRYLQKFSFKNVVQDQLFEVLQEQVELDGTNLPFTVKEIMDSWTLFTGFPLLKIHYSGSKDLVIVTQEQFTVADFKPAQRNLWFIPITYATKGSPDFSESNWRPKAWMAKEATLRLRISGAGQGWVIFNPDARNYYRVVYDSHFFAFIKQQLKANPFVISASSRSQMIDDYFQSAWAGYVTLHEALDLTTYLSVETSYPVWTTVLRNIKPSHDLLWDTDVYPYFCGYFLSKISDALNILDWDQSISDPPIKIIVRVLLLDWACTFGSPNCDQLTRYHVANLAAGHSIPPDLQSVVLCDGVRLNEQLPLDVRSYVVQKYLDATREERKRFFIQAIACDNVQSVSSWLDLATAPNSVFHKNAIELIQGFAKNPENRVTVIAYFHEHLHRIRNTLGENAISDVVKTISSYTSDASVAFQLSRLIEFALENTTSEDVHRSLKKSQAQVLKNAEWVSKWGPVYLSWFQRHA